jgi:hypothetical protein
MAVLGLPDLPIFQATVADSADLGEDGHLA